MNYDLDLPQSRMISSIFCAIALSIIWGCQSPPPPKPKTEQAQISGVITIDGKPIPANCDVVFSHKNEGVTLAAKSDALGKFSLNAMDPRIGIPAGTYQVAVRPPSAPAVELKPGTPEYEAIMKNEKSGPGQESDGNAAGGIPAKYHQHETSGLVVDAKPGANDFKLELAN